ncbi:MAG: ATP-binding cassette domain-containing protein [Bacteriovoracales bacterium]
MLKAQGISKKLGSQFLFEKISLELKEKDLIFIKGKSGSGKSIFLRSLTLLTPVDEGKITFLNEEITDVLNFRSQVHYLRQDFIPTLSTGEEVLSEAFSLNVYKEKKHLDPGIFLEEFGLTNSFLKKKAPLMSGGERQILHLIRSLCLSPRALLLDEPTSAMDPQTKRSAERLITRFVESGGAVVWVTHENNPLERLVYKFPLMEKI